MNGEPYGYVCMHASSYQRSGRQQWFLWSNWRSCFIFPPDLQQPQLLTLCCVHASSGVPLTHLSIVWLSGKKEVSFPWYLLLCTGLLHFEKSNRWQIVFLRHNSPVAYFWLLEAHKALIEFPAWDPWYWHSWQDVFMHSIYDQFTPMGRPSINGLTFNNWYIYFPLAEYWGRANHCDFTIFDCVDHQVAWEEASLLRIKFSNCIYSAVYDDALKNASIKLFIDMVFKGINHQTLIKYLLYYIYFYFISSLACPTCLHSASCTHVSKSPVRCQELTIGGYMHKHITITNVIVFAFHFTCR